MEWCWMIIKCDCISHFVVFSKRQSAFVLQVQTSFTSRPACEQKDEHFKCEISTNEYACLTMRPEANLLNYVNTHNSERMCSTRPYIQCILNDNQYAITPFDMLMSNTISVSQFGLQRTQCTSILALACATIIPLNNNLSYNQYH